MDTALLKSTEIFSGLNDDDLAMLQGIASVKSYGQEDVVFEDNSPGDAFFIIKKGRVEIAKYVAGGRRRVLAILEEGDIFGELSIFESENHTAGAKAESAVELILFQKDDFLKLLSENDAMANKIYQVIIRQLCTRLRETSLKLNENVVWGFKEILSA